MKTPPLFAFTCLSLLLFTGTSQAQSAHDQIAMVKASVMMDKSTLRQYEWIETTTVSINGDVKSTKQQRCYYGADGSVQKVEISDDQSSGAQGGPFRRRIMERKKEEMTDYMKSAVALVKSYVPPSASKIQAAKDAGNFSVVPQPGHQIRIVFTSYQLPGDTYTMQVNMTTHRPEGLKVATYLNSPSDPITLNVVMGHLDNGTGYADNITLNAPSKNLTVTVHNSGYRRMH